MVALVCDDDAVWCRALSRVLQGRTVAQAHDIESALLIAEKIQPNVIVLDSLLPDGLGWQAIPRFRIVSPQSEIIIMTAHARITDGLRCIGDEYRAFAYLDKAEGIDAIRQTVRDATTASLIGAIRSRFEPLPASTRDRLAQRYRA